MSKIYSFTEKLKLVSPSSSGGGLVRFAAKVLACAVLAVMLLLAVSHEAIGQSASPAITIRSIEVKGNRRVDRSTVLFYVRLKEGNSYTNTELVKQTRADVRAIYKLGFFRDVKVQVESLEGGLRVIYQLSEKPTINQIEIIGNSSVDLEKIRERVTVKVQTIVSESILKETVRNIRKLYQELGHYFARIEAVLKESGQNTVAVTILIDEGESVLIGAINFEGSDNVSKRDLLKAMETSESGIFSFLTSSGIFNEDELQRDLVRIRLLYESRGYAKVQVGQPTIREDREKGRISITISISEGSRYQIAKIDIRGGEDVIPREEIGGKMLLFVGDVFNKSRLISDVQAITNQFSNRGYAFVDVNSFTKTDDKKKTVDITIRINKGRRVYIGKVGVKGNTRTRENVIRRDVRVIEGSLYSKKGLDLTRRRLVRKNYFETVKVVEKRRPGSDEILDIEIEVKEKPTGSITGGIGINSDEGFYGQGEIRESNLFGMGLVGSLFTRISSERFDLVAEYFDPNFRDSGYSLGGSLFFVDQEYETFDNERQGARITVGKEFQESLRAFVSYEIAESLISNVDDTATSTILEQDGETFLESSIIPRLVYDSLNRPIFPTDGTYWSVGTTISTSILGGNVDVFSTEAEFRQYHNIGERFRIRILRDLVLSLRGNLRYVDSFKDEVPAFRRLYASRRHAVRGFSSSDLGPKDTQGEAIGGFSSALASVELTHPFIGPTQVAVFFDMGNIWDEDNAFDLGDLRLGAGVGLRIVTPIGPMRLDIGYKLDRKTNERRRETHLGIGAAF